MRYSLVFALALLVPSTAQAISYNLDVQNYTFDLSEGNVHMPEAEIFLTHDLTETFGIFAFSLVNAGPQDGFEGRWAQTQFGPTVNLTEGLQLGAGPALEQADISARATLWAFWELDSESSLFAVFEHGFDGSEDYWYQVVANRSFGIASVGVMAERTFGVGPRADFGVPGTPFRLYAVGARDFESDTTNLLTGLAWDGPS